jgi:hypothetical protein
VKDEKGDLVADSHSILAKWRNHFSQLLNVHGVNDVRQTEIHTAQPQMFHPTALEVDITTEKLKGQKSPGIDQIPAEFIKVEDTKIHYKSINILILFGIRRDDKTDFSNYREI